MHTASRIITALSTRHTYTCRGRAVATRVRVCVAAARAAQVIAPPKPGSYQAASEMPLSQLVGGDETPMDVEN